jgi:lipoprotein-releasing system permease protein
MSHYSFFIARRYLTARRKQAFISVITFISMLGIAIGVMALIIAIALITGFQQDVQDKILGTTSHLMISDLMGEGIADHRTIMDKAGRVPGVVSVSPVAYSTVLITGPAQTSGVLFKGIDFEAEMADAPWLRRLDMGRLPESGTPEEILLGREVAFRLGAGVGDIVTVMPARSRISPIGPIPKLKRYRVSGLFNAGLYEFDASTVLASLETAQGLLELDDKVSYLHVRIDDIFRADRIGEALREVLPPTIYITTWMELNRSLFSALKLEKTILFLTITLIVIVAALNIIATLILMVMEKTRDIGILMAMGATAADIRKIFFLQGAMIGTLGTTAGVLLGLAWCWAANTFELIRIPVDIYQISFVPFKLRGPDLALIVGVTLGISLLSTLFPAGRASRVDPVTALKYE